MTKSTTSELIKLFRKNTPVSNKLILAQVLEKHPFPFELFDYQREDIEAALQHDRFALFNCVGSGKTATATAIALAWNDPTIILVLPPVLITQWLRWLNSIPNSGGAIAFRGPPKKRYELPVENFRWIVMSIDIFKIDFDALYDHYYQPGVTLVVDEAHCLRNSSSNNFKKVMKFSVGRKLLLATGTELNNPGDSYGYIKLKTPAIYRTKTHFDNLHVESRDFYDKPLTWEGLDVINSNLYKASTKRTKEDVHKHLPKANYVPLVYELSPAHMKLYNKLADEMLLELPDGGKIDATTGSALYNALQQVIVNWNHFSGDQSNRPAIFDVIDQVCEEIQLGEKGSSQLIIWTWFKMTTEAVRDYMNMKFPGSTVAAYSGSNPAKSVERFLEDPSCTVLIAQPGSAGMGLNPQHLCWETLFVEAPTRTIQFKQAAGRIDREGQRYNPTIRIAMALNTLQMSMFRSLLANDAQVMQVQDGANLRKAIYGD